MRIPESILEILRREERFVILSHINPEGDALGSSIALALALRRMGKAADVYNRDGLPSIYGFLPGSDLVRRLEEMKVTPESVVVILDCNDLERVGISERMDCKLSMVIDHHETESDYGDIRWIEPECPATGMMIYYLLKSLDAGIDSVMATNLYTAISIDTGTFRYSNTTAETLLAGADLIRYGADPSFVAERLYESWSRNRFMLLIETLNTLEINRVGSITVATTVITSEMFRRTGTTSSDTENFSNFPRKIEEVHISALFRETEDGRWKASLRSKGDVNVARIASHFGGGGHKNAAGFLLEGDIEEIKRAFLKAVSENLLVKT